MSESSEKKECDIDFVLPDPYLFCEPEVDYILCKPKLMPLKSVTLEKLEKMQKDAETKLRESQSSESTNTENWLI